MDSACKNQRTSLKSIAWSALWGAALTAFIVFSIEANNRCFVIVNGKGFLWAITISIWLWLTLFLFLDSIRGRLVLLAFTVLIFLALPNVDRFPLAVAETNAVRYLRQLGQALESYRTEHPNEGYPLNLPIISTFQHKPEVEKLYKLDFITTRSRPDGPVDGFLLQATPLWRDCGFVRSFAAAENGLIYFTLQAKPASRADAVLQ